ncbi:VanZ family protein [Weeksellaceae bacterium KMM 9713]|uniref:VanZ family protein n=1 Tax=Profundicola chukchiensis TaxID=2961959 RepID=A0A9X4RTL1_9FLAO|nr:VanZ family protein [Profundicola chukchiensis]MDG4945133.1 VanZ family protein [Profundicola chukchiensis]MDG4950212.1 VanZ family protein [Profundicola chukchiensis]
MFLVTLATLTPLDGIPPIEIGFDFVDKIIHLIIFLVLTILSYFAYPNFNRWINLAWLVLFGLLIEVLQHSLPTGRSFDWYDWIFDIIGVVLAFAVCYYTGLLEGLKKKLDRLFL